MGSYICSERKAYDGMTKEGRTFYEEMMDEAKL